LAKILASQRKYSQSIFTARPRELEMIMKRVPELNTKLSTVKAGLAGTAEL